MDAMRGGPCHVWANTLAESAYKRLVTFARRRPDREQVEVEQVEANTLWTTCQSGSALVAKPWKKFQQKEMCQKSGGGVPRKDKGGRDRDYGAGICDKRLYPPCPSCGKSRPHKG